MSTKSKETSEGWLLNLYVDQPAVGLAVFQIPIAENESCQARVIQTLRREESYPLHDDATIAAVEKLLSIPPRTSKLATPKRPVAATIELMKSTFDTVHSLRATTIQEHQHPAATTTSSIPTACQRISQEPSQRCVHALAQMEIQFSTAMTQLIAKREEALEEARMKHASIMQRAQEKLEKVPEFSDKIGRLVDHQVKELDNIESSFAAQLQALKQAQKKEYRQAVFAQLDSLQHHEANTANPSPAPGTATTNTSASTNANACTSSSSNPPPNTAPPTSSSTNPPNNTVPTPPPPKSLIELLSSQKQHACHQIWIGSQVKRGYHIWIVETEPLAFLTIPHASTSSIEQSLSAHVLVFESLYSSNNVGAWVRVVTPKMAFAACDSGNSSTGTSDWAALVTGTTELHFPSAEVQLAKLREEMQSRELVTGDMLVTRHSNVNFAVNFHLVVQDKDREELIAEATNPQSHLMQGLVHALNTADDNGINTICMRSNMLHGVTPKGDADIARVVTLLKTIKMFMADNCAGSGSISNFVIMVPHSEESARFHKVVQTLRQQFGC